MDHRDLDIYLLAKRQQKRAVLITVVALALVGFSGVLLFLGIASAAVKGVLIGSGVGLVLVNSEFGLYGAVVSKRALPGVIQNQINRDPDALAYLSERS